MTNKLLFLVGAVLLFISCDEAESILQVPGYNETSFIKKSPFPGCTDHEISDLTEDGLDNILGYEIWNGLYFINAFDNFTVREGGFDGATIIQESFTARKLLATDERMFITSFDGLFSVDKDGVLTQHLSDSCGDIVLSPNGEIILSAVAPFKEFQLLKLEDDFTLSSYTDSHDAASNCVPLRDIHFVDEQNVFAATCEGYIIHFNDGKYIESFGPEEMNFGYEPVTDQFFVRAHEDDLIVVAKNGARLYSILKYTAEGDWIILKNLHSDDVLEAKDNYMLRPLITDALVHNDKLYVTTTISGCLGVQEYDISRNEALSDEDYNVIQDPEFPTQCLEGIQVDQQGNISFITSHSEIVQMTCN